MQDVTIIEGRLVAEGKTRVAIISARFNGFIVEALEAGCLDTLRRHGVEVVGDDLEIGVHLERDHDDADVVPGEGVDSICAVDGDDRVFDRFQDLPFHVPRSGTGVRHRDGHDGQRHVGIEVRAQPRGGDEA